MNGGGVSLIMLYMEMGVVFNKWRVCGSDNVVYGGGGCLQ